MNKVLRAITTLILWVKASFRYLWRVTTYWSTVPLGMPVEREASEASTDRTGNSTSSQRLNYVLGGIGLYFGSFFLLWRLAVKSTWIITVVNSTFSFDSLVAIIIISTGLSASGYAIRFILAELYTYAGSMISVDNHRQRRADYAYILLLLSVLIQFLWLVWLTVVIFIPMKSGDYFNLSVLIIVLLFLTILFVISRRTSVQFGALLIHWGINSASVFAIAIAAGYIVQSFQNVSGSALFRFASGPKATISYQFKGASPHSFRVVLDKMEASGSLAKKETVDRKYTVHTQALQGSYKTININKWIKFENRNDIQFSETDHIRISKIVPSGLYLCTISFLIGSRHYFMKEVVDVSGGTYKFSKGSLKSKL